ncbi:hypothetical protein ACH0AC_10820 [Micrococcus luteus]|uniref:RraA family protein n=1 Tax=Micrococcus luteus TaxID=1270 RepID=UPI00387A65FD
MKEFPGVASALEEVRAHGVTVANLSDAMDYLSVYDQVVVGLRNFTPASGRFSGLASTVRWIRQRKDRSIMEGGQSTWQSVKDFVRPVIEEPGVPTVYVAGAGELVMREALLGGLSAYYLTETLGFEAIVLGGSVRDHDDLDTLRKPILASNYSPIDTQGSYIADADSGYCSIEGVRVENGDLVVGDRSGVAVIPSSKAWEVVQKAVRLKESEAGTRHRLTAGEALTDIIEDLGHI